MADIIIYSGNSGELSPKLDGRSDLEKYYTGNRIYKNVIPTPYGPSDRRPGTYFVAELKDSDKKARLQAFQYSTEQAYIIEFGDQYARFYKDRGQILGGDGTENIDHLDNVIAHWLLNDDEGSTVVIDDDGATHNMTSSVDTDVLNATGIVGIGCFDLDGQYDAEIAHHGDFSFTDDSDDSAFSLNCWGYVTEKGDVQVLTSKWQNDGGTEWRLSLSADRKLQLHLGDTSTTLSGDAVAQWKLNDTDADQVVDDATGNGHTGATETADVADLSATGKTNMTPCFDLGGADCVIVPDHANLSFGNGAADSAFSIAAWIYVVNAGVQQILTKWDQTTGSQLREWQLALNSGEAVFLNCYDESANANIRKLGSNTLATGWNFVVATYDGSGTPSGINIYVNGALDTGATPSTSGSYTAMENTVSKVHIGAYIGSGGSLSDYFADKIDNVVLFDIELTAANVSALWKGGDGTEALDVGIEISAISDDIVTLGWHMFSSTYSAPADETVAADGILLYVDGAAVDSTATNDAAYTAMQTSGMEIRIGSQRNSADSANEKFWGDKIDEASIFGDVLTPTEIAGLYTAVAYEISTDYLEADLFKLQHAQSADVLFNVHGSYPQSQLARYEHNLWEISDVVYDWPPFMDQNASDITITPSAKIGTVTLTASAPHFTEDMVGGYFRIKHPRQDNHLEKSLTDDYDAFVAEGITDILVDVEGAWRCKTSDTWTGTVLIERAYDEELILVLDSAPAGGAWEAGDIITGGTSANTCVIVSVTDSTHYYIKHLSGSFTDNEILSNQSANSRDCAATYPRYEGWTAFDPMISTQDTNHNVVGNEVLGDAYLRARRTVDNAGNDPTVAINVERYYYFGIVKITGFTSSTEVTAEVIRPLGSTDATKLWSEGLWSDERGYPSTLAFYEGRLFYAGMPFSPLDIVGSAINQYDNMKTGSLATDSVKYTVDSSTQNQIRWIVGHETLLIGTSGGEWRLGSTNPAQAISPTNPMKPRLQTTYGSKEIQALLLANAVLFVDKKGRRVRGAQYIFEQGESGGYDAPDYTMMADHITDSGIVDMAFQQNPYSILWCVLTNGNLIGMTFEPSNKQWGWFRFEIDGLVESVSVIPGEDEDEVWIIVKRTINSITKRYVEYFKPRDWGDDQADCFFVDSGLTFDGGDAVTITGASLANPCVITAANTFTENDQVKIVDIGGTVELNNKVYTVTNPTTTTFEIKDATGTAQINSSAFTTYTSGGTAQQVENRFSGLDHLEGKEVSVLGDGAVHPNVTVSSGAVTLTQYYNKVHIGLPFESTIQPMELAIPGSDIRGRKKAISQVIFSFLDTLGATFGVDDGTETIPFRKVTDPLGSPPPLFTGKKQQTFTGGYSLDGNITVKQTQPLPMTVRSITVKVGVFE